MKLSKARELGEACGLTTDAMCIVNVEIHATSLFTYVEMGAELMELREDAIANGLDYDKIVREHTVMLNSKLSKANTPREWLDCSFDRCEVTNELRKVGPCQFSCRNKKGNEMCGYG